MGNLEIIKQLEKARDIIKKLEIEKDQSPSWQKFIVDQIDFWIISLRK